jgi:ABC-type transport system involved in cytochrome c biogenesis permease subunit
MQFLLNVHVSCFLMSYLTVFALEVIRIYSRWNVSRTVTNIITMAGFVAHTTYLLSRHQQTQLPPLLSSTQDWLLVLGWVLILFLLIINLIRRELSIGLFILPLTMLLIAAASQISDSPEGFVRDNTELLESAKRRWLMLHTSTLLIGLTGVTLSIALSTMYVYQHRRLKQKKFLGQRMKLPSLEKLAQWNWWSVTMAVPLLFLGMFTGGYIWYLNYSQKTTITLSHPTIIINCIALVIMAIFYIWLLVKKKDSAGKHVAWMTLWACGFSLFTIVGIMFFGGGHTL